MGKYTAVKVKANQYIIYGIFALIIAFIAYYIIVYKSPKPFEKGKTIRWVVTGDDISPSDKRKTVQYSYNGVDYIPGEDDSLFLANGVGYGRSYDNENFFWIAGGMINPGESDPDTKSSMVNSYNGYTWIKNNNPLIETQGVEFVADENGDPLWLATGSTKEDGKNNIIFSRDGICWSHSTGLCFFSGNTIAYGNSFYVAGGIGIDPEKGNYNILYSNSSLSWRLSKGASFSGSIFSYCAGLDYGLSSDKITSLWVAVGYAEDSTDNTNILYSLDGITWDFSTGMSFYGGGQDVAFGLDDADNPIWVAIGEGESSILYSDDGKNWVKATGISFSAGNGVAYGKDSNEDSFWVATGNDINGGKDEILYSYNGKHWVSTEDPAFGLSIGRGVASNILKYGVKPYI